ncbi:MAG: M12 family metallo-peptidase [Ferruginibacter sp.]|nr:M12 family metallo-peptidase [Ferruginibacter sp.]
METAFNPYLKQGQTANFNSTIAQDLISKKINAFTFTFEFENKEWEIVLKQNNPLSKSFFATTGTDPANKFMYENTALHYKGFIKGKPHSFAAVSILNDKLIAVIADEKGNINIGAINNASAQQTNEHIIYRETDLLIKNEFECGTENLLSNSNNIIPSYTQQATTAATINVEPIDIYFEADYRTYLNNGSNVTNTLNYVTALFNVVKTMYQNDSINVQISAIKIWNTIDPYNSIATSSNVLTAFSSNMAIGFPGDLAHLLSQRSIGGGVAYLNSICNNNNLKTAVSGNLTNSFNALPVYSWPVMVITHELGHNLGSPHTQSCSWPGGAIDNCYATEGGCPQGPSPTNGGTVMSYCHLNIGINLANGFGPLPGQKIRNIIRNNTCLNPVIYFETTSQNINEENADVENGCFDYTLLTTKLKIPYAPTQPVNITLVPSGSANVGTNADVEITPLSFTLDATNLTQTINFKIYNDAEIEAPEMLLLNFNINANGGNAIKRNTSFSHTIIITNDDHRPDSTVNQPLYYEPFNNIVSGLGNWTQTITYGLLSPNRWVIGNSGDAEFSTKAAYISNNAGSLTYSGAVLNDSAIIRLESPLINASGFSNMRLNYLYKCNGEYNFVNSGANGGGFVYLDYGKVLMSIDNGITWTVIKDNIAARFQKSLEDILLPVSANNMSTLKLAFEWRNNSSVVNNFPFIIDSVVVNGTATSPIQTLANAGNIDEEYLGPNQTVHYYNPITKNIMATIENQSAFDFGCTKVELIRTGNSAALAWGTLASNRISDKVYKITPGNINAAAPYNVKLYYTDAEINGWLAATGNTLNDVRIVRTSGDLTAPPLGTTANFSSINNKVNFGATPHTVVSGNFTGFSTFAIMKPYGEPICPATVNSFGTNIIGSAYQWQVNNGAGYTNVINNAVYNGATTDSLKLTTAPRSYFGNKYRCEINTLFGTVYSPEYILKAGMTWLGTVSTAWENPLNWSCNMVPDDKTDVTIHTGTPFSPELNVSTTIRSLTALQGTNILIKNGAVLSLVYQ